MRIGIDVRSLSAGKNSGVEEYIRNLLPELFKLDQKNEYLLFTNGFKNRPSTELKLWSRLPNVKLVNYAFPNKILNGFLWLFNLPPLDYLLGGVDLFFLPNLNFFALSRKTPFVITFHDLSYEHFPHFFNLKRRFWHFLINPRQKALRAEKIITVSEATAHDLAKTYRVSPDRIETIHLGLATEFLKGENSKKPEARKSLLKKYGISNRPFFLFLGTIEPRKNLIFLIKAFNLFKKNNKTDHILLIAGSRGWSFGEVFAEFEKSPFKKDILFIGTIENTDRAQFYREAELFLFPSLFEGFGLPPLEALAVGTPVLASLSSSLLEILGNKAILSNPYDVGEFVNAMEKIIKDQKLQQKLSIEGKNYAKQFTWERTAKKTLALFESILLKKIYPK